MFTNQMDRSLKLQVEFQKVRGLRSYVTVLVSRSGRGSTNHGGSQIEVGLEDDSSLCSAHIVTVLMTVV